MAFKLKEFMNTDLQPRRLEVKALGLKDWFEGGEDAVFVVRGLEGEEFYQVREAVGRRKDIQAIVSKLLSGDGQAIAEAIEEHLGDIPEEYVRRAELLFLGCVEPKLDRQQAVKILKKFPSDGHMIAEEILRATGQGATPGESKGCGTTPA